MRIQIGNYNTTSFNGYFYKNDGIKKVIAKTSDSELYRFNRLLERMDAKKDDVAYELLENVNDNFTKYKLCKYKESHTSIHKLIEIVNNTNNNLSGIIKSINDILEKDYPEVFVKDITREETINKIMKILL